MKQKYVEECKVICASITQEQFGEKFALWKSMAASLLDENDFDEAKSCCEVLHSMQKFYLERCGKASFTMFGQDWHNVRIAMECQGFAPESSEEEC